jgi:serpin B
MKKIIWLIISTIVLLSMVSCGQSTGQPVKATLAQSDKPRDTSPAVSSAELDILVDGNSTFAFNLYQALKGADGNLFYSPYSISEALAMTYAGARGETERQMEEALRFQLSQADLHPAFNSLDLQLANRGQGAQGKDSQGFRLHVVNALWGQKDFSFLPAYLDLLAVSYGAGLRLLDFINAAEPSRQTINQWVSEQTEDKIKDLLPPGSINELTRLVLTNAIYFNAAWQSQFEPEATTDGQFHLLTGKDVTVRMMHQTESLGYAKGNNYQAVELLYDGRELSMVILLPEEDQFKVFEDGLTIQRISEILQGINNKQVALSMPKFTVESQFGLKDTLGAMGMPVAFTDAADFSGMNGKKDLIIQDVVHKAYVAVDENGTEAAAATGVVVGVTSAPPEPVEVTIDHPFIFFIRDIQTGAILFVGRVIEPGT